MLCTDAQIVMSPHLYKMAVDPLKDITPVATLITTSMVLAVQPSLPVKNLQEFVAYARRANPPLAYASIGNGSLHHLVMEMFKQRAGIDMLHVPFKGGGPATLALLGGEVSAMFGGGSVSAHIRSGKLRGLAVAGRQRADQLAVLLAVADVHHRLVGGRMMRGVDRRQLAEALGEAHLLFLFERLPAQQDHQMAVPRLPDGREAAIVDRTRGVHAADLGAKRG